MVSALRPNSVQDALRMLSEDRLVPLAGGTDLMVHHKRSSGVQPSFEHRVLFIGHLKELKEVQQDGAGVMIGAACPYSDLLREEALPEAFKEVISQIASPAIRNRGTVGGNICNASPAGDTLPFLYALDAKLLLQRRGTERLLPVCDLITGPGQTVLEKDELLTRVIIPTIPFNTFYYRKVGARRANSCAKLSFIGFARVAAGRVEDIRIAFGAVAPTVVRSRQIEQGVKGKRMGEVRKMIPEVVGDYAELLRPIDDQRCTLRYRKAISLRLLECFLSDLLGER